jgi:hypothetical protein
MTQSSPARAPLGSAIFRPWAAICSVVAALAIQTVSAQESVNRTSSSTTSAVIVTGEEVPSAYGAPPEFSRSRFSNLTNAYVLPAGSVFAGLIYQGDALRFNRPDHMFTQEIEVGLPYRFGVAVENSVEFFRGESQDRTFSVEARFALADWNKIPLNPTIFFEWKFGLGTIFHDEGPPEPLPKGEAEEFLAENEPLPDSFEVRLLLAQDFGKAEWALNAFFEQEVGGDRGREWGFAQTVMLPVILPQDRLKVGVEMQLTTFTDKGIRDHPSYRFILGPTIAWKPSRNTRFDVSPLVGLTDDAPKISVFAVFSMLFGKGEETKQAEAPASTRNR